MTIPAGSTGSAEDPFEPHLACDACGTIQLLVGTEWHSISHNDRNACEEVEGAGYWVCTDCHEMIHEWMDANPEVKHPAKEAFHRFYKNLAWVILQNPRSYRRSTSAPSSPSPDAPGDDSP